MTYEDALKIISEIGKYSTVNGDTKVLRIVPLNNPYFKNFSEDLNSKILSDEDAKDYAKDNEFQIWQYSIYYVKGEAFKI